jgi:hypothetical protein
MQTKVTNKTRAGMLYQWGPRTLEPDDILMFIAVSSYLESKA